MPSVFFPNARDLGGRFGTRVEVANRAPHWVDIPRNCTPHPHLGASPTSLSAELIRR